MIFLLHIHVNELRGGDNTNNLKTQRIKTRTIPIGESKIEQRLFQTKVLDKYFYLIEKFEYWTDSEDSPQIINI